jgi:hypothetical protein
MTIGVHLNRQKVLFANFVKNSERTSEYDGDSKIDQSFSSKGITHDYNEEEVGLYALEAIPKVGVLFQAHQRVR